MSDAEFRRAKVVFSVAGVAAFLAALPHGWAIPIEDRPDVRFKAIGLWFVLLAAWSIVGFVIAFLVSWVKGTQFVRSEVDAGYGLVTWVVPAGVSTVSYLYGWDDAFVRFLRWWLPAAMDSNSAFLAGLGLFVSSVVILAIASFIVVDDD